MSVPSPGGEVDLQRPVERADAVLEATQPTPAGDAFAPPIPSSRSLDDGAPVLAPHVDARERRPRVLGDVGQRLRDDEVGRGLDRGGQPLAETVLSNSTATGGHGSPATRAPRRARAARAPRDGCRTRDRAAPRPPPARWRTRCRPAPARPARVLGEPLTRQLQLDHQRHEPLLRAVVQVAPEPPALRVARLDQAAPATPAAPPAGRAARRPPAGAFSSASAAAGRWPPPTAQVWWRQRRRVQQRADPAPLVIDLGQLPPGPGRPEELPVTVDVGQRSGSQKATISEGSPSASASASRRSPVALPAARSAARRSRPGRSACAAGRAGTRPGAGRSWR